MITVKQDCAACSCDGVLQTLANTNRDLDMAQEIHREEKGCLCVGVCLITVKQRCAACICEGVLQTLANSNRDLDMAQEIQREEKGCLCVGVCLITVKQDCAACSCEGVLQTLANSNRDLDMAQEIQREEKGCLCTRKGSGRPKTSEETVEHVRKQILLSPKKSLRRASVETQIPPTAV